MDCNYDQLPMRSLYQHMIMTDVFMPIPSAFLSAHCVLDTSEPQWVDMMPALQKLLNGSKKSRWVP